MKIWVKLRKVLYDACDIMEIFMAIAVAIGIIIVVFSIVPAITELWNHKAEAEAFMAFLDMVFNVVIGIEFMKMLCKPSAFSIIEVLVFLIARHMIIQATTAWEDLLAVISICLLFSLRRFMMTVKKEQGTDDFD